MLDKTSQAPANTNKGGAPKKLDKKVQIAIYLRKSVAHRWPRQAIEGLIERVESGEQVSGDTKPVSVAPKTQTPAPPLEQMEMLPRVVVLMQCAKCGANLSSFKPLK